MTRPQIGMTVSQSRWAPRVTVSPSSRPDPYLMFRTARTLEACAVLATAQPTRVLREWAINDGVDDTSANGDPCGRPTLLRRLLTDIAADRMAPCAVCDSPWGPCAEDARFIHVAVRAVLAGRL